MEEQPQALTPNLYPVRTDLAFEAHRFATQKHGKEIPGVKSETETENGIEITRLEVLDMEGAKYIGKLPGKYISLQVPGLRRKDSELQNRVAARFAREFRRFLQELGISENKKALVVGLGNWNVTPDALGPLVVENLVVTRHLFELMPEQVGEGYREVSALSPGVLGITGIETSEIVFGVVERTKPDFVIAVDALASRSVERVNTTIQISDTGINPGSGVGNKRKALTKETLGIPVIAIGVPTVCDAVTIVSDTIDYLLAHLGRQMKERQQPPRPASLLTPEGFDLPSDLPRYTPEDLPDKEARQVILGLIGGLEDEEKRQLIREVLTPMGHNLIVTPKEVDAFVEDIANVLAIGLNAALHDAIDMGNVSAYTH
ncbi:GPR endopeptidase [Bacillaceae bacterium]